MTPNGILPAAITPRRGLSVDVPAAIDLVHFLASHGAAGIVLFGSTGEFPHYGLAERIGAARTILKQARVPVLVNASHSTLEGAVEIARHALADGAAAAVVMPPYYFRYTQPQLREFYMRLGDAVEGPLSLYNIPIFSSELARETARDLLAQERFCALKDSSGDDSYLEFLIGTPGVKFYVGNDPAYRKLKAKGIHGAVSGIASAVPDLMVAIDSGDDARATAAERLLGEFMPWFRKFPVPVAIAQALEIRCGFPCPPAIPVADANELERFRGWVKEWIQEVEKLCKI